MHKVERGRADIFHLLIRTGSQPLTWDHGSSSFLILPRPGGRGHVIPGADPKTFTVIGVNYTKDANHVYWGVEGRLIPGADPKTFTIVSEKYAKDKAHVYNEEGVIIPNSSPAQCSDSDLKGCESKTPSFL